MCCLLHITLKLNTPFGWCLFSCLKATHFLKQFLIRGEKSIKNLTLLEILHSVSLINTPLPSLSCRLPKRIEWTHQIFFLRAWSYWRQNWNRKKKMWIVFYLKENEIRSENCGWWRKRSAAKETQKTDFLRAWQDFWTDTSSPRVPISPHASVSWL